MLDQFQSSGFRRDIKLQKKRGKDLDKLKEIILLLAHEKPLSPKYKDHPLVGSYKGYRECHIEPDWLLIYKREEGRIYLAGTGTHSDFFD